MSSKGRAVQGARTHSGSGKAGQKSFPLGRVCGQCGDPLSQYNPGPNCWNHTVEFPWRGVLLHHDRILFEIKIVGGSLLAELDGTTDRPEWVAPHDFASLDLVPFTARALGLPVVQNEVNRTPAIPDEHGEVAATGHSLASAKRVTRFGAYGVVTRGYAEPRQVLGALRDWVSRIAA